LVRLHGPQNTVIYSLEIIAEASNNLCLEFRQSQPGIERRAMIGVPNRAAHHDNNLGLALIWVVVLNEPPDLVERLSPLVKA